MTERRISGGAQRTSTHPQQARPQALARMVIALMVLAVCAIALSLSIRPTSGVDTATVVVGATSQPPTPLPSPTVVAPTPIPPNTQVNSYIALVVAAIGKGHYQQAITLAETALALPDVSAQDRHLLTEYLVSAGLKDIYAQPSYPANRDHQQALVDQYLSLAERAKGAGVSIDAPLEVATHAFASSQFALARVTLERALVDGAFDPSLDRDVTRMYVSTLFGLGKWYTTLAPNSPEYSEGVRWLVTSHAVAMRYQTGQSDAEALLIQLGYTTSEHWPSPLDTPLLHEQ